MSDSHAVRSSLDDRIMPIYYESRKVFFVYGKVLSASVLGVNGVLIEVELDISSGIPHMAIVGLPDSAIRESIERVRAAIKNSGFTFPMDRITVNLAPANLPKEGSAFDLAIAIGILMTSGQVQLPWAHSLIIGEISLDGTLRGVTGVLPMVDIARQHGVKTIIVAQENAAEASLLDDIEIIPLTHLRQLKQDPALFINDVNHHAWKHHTKASEAHSPGGECAGEDYCDVVGQHHAKRALTIAASGMHNIALVGPPGTGKTMLLRRLPTIMSPMSDQEALEVTKIHSAVGLLADQVQLIRDRPFRSPHHTISVAGLIGGGSHPKPGEVSLAHNGILYLDELPEFSRSVLESLRQPLEDGRVTVARARAVYSFPARFLLAASMNPCQCGFHYAETPTTPCTCSPLMIRRYRSRISGPLLDRIDMHIDVPRIEYQTFGDDTAPLSSQQMRESVLTAQERQKSRYRGMPIQFNSELTGKLLRQYCRLGAESEKLLQQYYSMLGLSARAHDRILKLARTIADIEGSEEIEHTHLAEALQYRQLDKGWE